MTADASTQGAGGDPVEAARNRTVGEAAGARVGCVKPGAIYSEGA